MPVAIVARPDFSAELPSLAGRMHVWVIDTPENKRAVELIWSSQSYRSGPIELTTFKGDPENNVVGILETVEDHHSEYAQPGPYDELIVIGQRLTPEARAECEDFGFTQFEETEEGFRALRGSNNELLVPSEM